MNVEEFSKRVKELSAARSDIWVSTPLFFDKSSGNTIRILLDSLVNCEQCGKCCDGTWFKVVPISPTDYGRILGTGATVFEFEDASTTVKHEGHDITCLKEPCYFQKDKKCSIYNSRPITCRQFPILIDDRIKINVSCPAGLELYLKLAEKSGFVLDSEGL